jgi:hypothetical protein
MTKASAESLRRFRIAMKSSRVLAHGPGSRISMWYGAFVSFAPFGAIFIFGTTHPGLAPWAAFFRRFAAKLLVVLRSRDSIGVPSAAGRREFLFEAQVAHADRDPSTPERDRSDRVPPLGMTM